MAISLFSSKAASCRAVSIQFAIFVGTPFGDVRAFREKFIAGDQIVWALENCDMNAPDFYRSILRLYNAGWFDHTAGIIFGRTAAGGEGCHENEFCLTKSLWNAGLFFFRTSLHSKIKLNLVLLVYVYLYSAGFKPYLKMKG